MANTMIMKIEEEINFLEKEKDKIQKTICLYKEIFGTYPDVEICSDSWKRKNLCSVLVNPIVTNVHFKKYESTWDNGVWIFALLYVLIENQEIYSNPCEICIGDWFMDKYIMPSMTWEDNFAKYKINSNIIEKTKRHLRIFEYSDRCKYF